MRNFFLCALATLGLALGATVVWGVGSAVTLDPSTGKTYPQQISAGYLATADGGVVAVLNSPAPTATGQTLCSKTTGHNATAEWGTCGGAAQPIPGGDEWIDTANGTTENGNVLFPTPPSNSTHLIPVTITSSSTKAAGTFYATPYTSPSLNVAQWPSGSLSVKFFFKVNTGSAVIHLDYGRCTYACSSPTLLVSNAILGTVSSTSLVEVDATIAVAGLAGNLSDVIYAQVWATVSSGTVTVSLADNSTNPSKLNAPVVPQPDLSIYEQTVYKGSANGYAGLDPNNVVFATNLALGTPYQGRILTACGGTGGVDTSLVCSNATWVNPPPVISVDTVAPTPIIPRTDTSTGTDTYPSPALHSHRFGDNTACDGCVPVGRTSSSSGTQTTTNTGVSHIVWEKPAPAPTPAGLLLGEFTLTTTCTATSTSVVYTPVTGTKREEVEYLAGGGGSGYCPNPGANYSQTGGGAAGENAFLLLNQSSQLNPWNYCAGSAGVGATSGVSATDGGDTLLYINSVLYTAKGGGQSPNATAGADLMNGGAGAAHTTGGNPAWFFPGADGSYGIAPQANHMLAGAGASSRYGTGGNPRGASGTNRFSDGSPATGWGAGGGGCYNNCSGETNNGANGSQGVIIVRDYTW
jgi:hypothetical protein